MSAIVKNMVDLSDADNAHMNQGGWDTLPAWTDVA